MAEMSEVFYSFISNPNYIFSSGTFFGFTLGFWFSVGLNLISKLSDNVVDLILLFKEKRKELKAKREAAEGDK